MPSENKIDQEANDEDIEWKKYLEEHKRSNPIASRSPPSKGKFQMLNKDGLSMQEMIQLKMRFSLNYKI